MIYTTDGNRCDLLTISSFSHMLDDKEPTLRDLYPDEEPRARQFSRDKEIVFVTARVHPGETPAAHICNGVINFLTSNDPRATILREIFVFKVVPMINPDGVRRGHFRSDQFGVNLNRKYQDPILETQQTVYAIRKLVEYYQDRIFFYIDLHAHSNKKAAFIFGNFMEYSKCIYNYMTAKLMQLNCVNFDINHCVFTEQNMYSGDKKGDSKAGSSRVAFYLNFGIQRIYTLECNYHMSTVVNPVPASGLPESSLTDPKDARYSKGPAIFDLLVFHDIGTAVCVSILDLTDKNPWSRLQATEAKDLRGFKGETAFDLLQRIPYRFDAQLRKYLKNKDGLMRHLEAKEGRVLKPMNTNNEIKPWQSRQKRARKTKRGPAVEIFVKDPKDQFEEPQNEDAHSISQEQTDNSQMGLQGPIELTT